jgi:hypothetical protein
MVTVVANGARAMGMVDVFDVVVSAGRVVVESVVVVGGSPCTATVVASSAGTTPSEVTVVFVAPVDAATVVIVWDAGDVTTPCVAAITRRGRDDPDVAIMTPMPVPRTATAAAAPIHCFRFIRWLLSRPYIVHVR